MTCAFCTHGVSKKTELRQPSQTSGSPCRVWARALALSTVYSVFGAVRHCFTMSHLSFGELRDSPKIATRDHPASLQDGLSGPQPVVRCSDPTVILRQCKTPYKRSDCRKRIAFSFGMIGPSDRVFYFAVVFQRPSARAMSRNKTAAL